jgi:glycosyltransferase involved in cell wall biosynthesis
MAHSRADRADRPRCLRAEGLKTVRILLVNAFHYLKGGVERTYLDESRWLAAAGHTVGHFAIRDRRNLYSPTAAYFAPEADFGEAAPALVQLASLGRAVWSAPAARCMDRLLAEFRPEIAHLHAPSRYLTPSILGPLERRGVPTVMTLHDFKPWCTNRILFAKGAPCERCRGGAHWHALTTGCVQDSRLKSAVGMVEAYTHDARHAYRHVKRWIAPSRFVHEKASSFGLTAAQMSVLAHGVEPTLATAHAAPRNPPAASSADTLLDSGITSPYALFAGRLSIEKGVKLLPEIARAIAPVPLVVVGDGPLRDFIRTAADATTNLRPVGHLDDAHLATLRREAAVVVVPSLFYEHFCYAAAEALLDERPVVAARIGAIPELVEHEVTGLLATPGDGAALGAAVRRALNDAAARSWASAGAARVRERANPTRHVEGLLRIYEEARS